MPSTNNDITKQLFDCVKENSKESFEKINSLLMVSNMAMEKNLSELSINFQATLTEKGEDFGLLSYALFYDNLPAFNLLIEKVADVNLGSLTPLYFATKANLEDIALRLITLGANLNQGNKSPLSCAIELNYSNLITKFIQYGADVNKGDPTPLMYAVKKNNYDLTSLLLENNCTVDKPSSQAVSSNAEVVIVPGRYSNSKKTYYEAKTEMQYVQGSLYITPLYQAVREQNIKLVRLLLLNDADASRKMELKLKVQLAVDPENETTRELLRKWENNSDAELARKMMECSEKIKLAKNAFEKKESAKMISNLCEAYDIDAIFLLDYLSHKIHQVNLNNYSSSIFHTGYILLFIKTISFISKETGLQKNKDKEIYNYIQENLLLELIGHDPEKSDQKVKLFQNYEEKNAYLKSFSIGASWENTFLAMQGTESTEHMENDKKRKVQTFEETQCSAETEVYYPQATLINNLGMRNNHAEVTNLELSPEEVTQPAI